ncbi:uncharacterized protein PG986_007934 [Apiospora aurea]|uniref:DUF7587 domain-containing protein n=1 Tax=Apiospora aurea TaxID=335848 RepID=A0ABR1QE02_9PEZI
MDEEGFLGGQNPLSLLLRPSTNEHREPGLQVALWGPKKIEQAAEPETLAWVVDHEKNHTGRVWAKEPVRQELKDKYGVGSLLEDPDSFHGTFVNGRPLKQVSITIHPCLGVSRPKRLFRVVHSDQPFNGIQFQKHMVWQWRGQSPFMSSTISFNKAVWKCVGYEKRNRPNIKILIIDTSGPGWGSRRQIWEATKLESAFNVIVNHTCLGEYLVSHSIPLHRVKVIDWEDLKEDRIQYGSITEPEEGWLQYERNKEAARQAVEPDDQAAPRDNNDNDDNKDGGTEQASKGSKRKRDGEDGEDEDEAPRRQGKRARGFAPLKERDMHGDAS